MPRPKKTPTAAGRFSRLPFGDAAPATDLSRVADDDLVDELHNRGFITARPDEGRPEPVEVPAIEAMYTEVLARESSVAAGSASRRRPGA